MTTRRTFIVSVSAGAVAGSWISPRMVAATGFKIPLGIQLYTLRAEMAKDLENTLRSAYAAGFREIEFAGYYGRSPAVLAALTKSIGFTLVSTHVTATDIAANASAVISDAKALGVQYIIAAAPMAVGANDKLPFWDKLHALTPADWAANAELFNKFAAQVQEAGMQFGYHNHHVEFRKFGDKTAYETLMSQTDPNLVKLQLDVGWATAAGVDPVALLKQFKNRVVSLHVKDIAKLVPDPRSTEITAIGEGVVDWKKVIGAAREVGVAHYFYEQDTSANKTMMDSMKLSAKYLSSLTV